MGYGKIAEQTAIRFARESKMEKGKNQYGRKTWDVDAYARIAKERREGTSHSQNKNGANAIKNSKKENILRQAVGGSNSGGHAEDNSRFGEDNSWFKCQVCRRRFKDSLKLSEHLSSRMHQDRMRELSRESEEEVGGFTHRNTPITLEKVKQHLAMLAEKKGHL